MRGEDIIILAAAVTIVAIVGLAGCVGNADVAVATTQKVAVTEVTQKATTTAPQKATTTTTGAAKTAKEDAESSSSASSTSSGDYASVESVGEEPLIGGQRDAHGCLIPAGYSWNETEGKCMRSFSGEVQDENTPGVGGKECGPCPQIMPPGPGFCKEGTIVRGRINGCGCMGPPRCLAGEGILEGGITIGPICPVERNPPDPRCAPTAETYLAHKLIVFRSGRETNAGEFYGDANGRYSITLEPGTYTVQTERALGPGSIAPATVTIRQGEITTLDIDVDTGIR